MEVPLDGLPVDCFLSEGVNGNHPQAKTSYLFYVHTRPLKRPGKKGKEGKERRPVFNFCAETSQDFEEWKIAFQEGIRPRSWLNPLKDEERRLSLLSLVSNVSTCSSETEEVSH